MHHYMIGRCVFTELEDKMVCAEGQSLNVLSKSQGMFHSLLAKAVTSKQCWFVL